MCRFLRFYRLLQPVLAGRQSIIEAVRLHEFQGSLARQCGCNSPAAGRIRENHYVARGKYHWYWLLRLSNHACWMKLVIWNLEEKYISNHIDTYYIITKVEHTNSEQAEEAFLPTNSHLYAIHTSSLLCAQYEFCSHGGDKQNTGNASQAKHVDWCLHAKVMFEVEWLHLKEKQARIWGVVGDPRCQ